EWRQRLLRRHHHVGLQASSRFVVQLHPLPRSDRIADRLPPRRSQEAVRLQVRANGPEQLFATVAVELDEIGVTRPRQLYPAPHAAVVSDSRGSTAEKSTVHSSRADTGAMLHPERCDPQFLSHWRCNFPSVAASATPDSECHNSGQKDQKDSNRKIPF